MDKFDIYNDIAQRTQGDIYIGVVGPCLLYTSRQGFLYWRKRYAPSAVGA